MHKRFLRSDATPLTIEAIEEIRNASRNISNASRIMCKKYQISMKRYKNIVNNQMPSESTEKQKFIASSSYLSQKINWNKEIEGIYDLYAKLSN